MLAKIMSRQVNGPECVFRRTKNVETMILALVQSQIAFTDEEMMPHCRQISDFWLPKYYAASVLGKDIWTLQPLQKLSTRVHHTENFNSNQEHPGI